MDMNELIECTTCHEPVARLAAACPKCGAPNTWVHPAIAKLIAGAATIGTVRPFNFTYTKTAINGQTASYTPSWAWALIAAFLVMGAIAFLANSWGWLAICAFAAAFTKTGTQRFQSFSADLQAGTWTSTDEYFWAPVRKELAI